MFSEHRELALSVVFCLLPSSTLSLPSPVTLAASLQFRAAGKPAAKNCSRGPAFTWPGGPLVCPALPCPMTAWDVTSSW